MPEFFELPREDQREALLVAVERSGRPLHLLEKDVWVVWALRQLFGGRHAQHLVFKGGTSLSKAYGVIRRFSEDVDLTYDIRAIAPDLIEEAGSPWPASRSQEKKWSKAIRLRLADLVRREVAPALAAAVADQGLPALSVPPENRSSSTTRASARGRATCNLRCCSSSAPGRPGSPTSR